MADHFVPHPIQWNRVYTERFWDFISSRPDYQSNNFGNLVGDAIIKIARRYRIPLHGRVLDFGCGPGFFLEKLLRQGIACQGVDISPKTVEMAEDRLQHYSLFRGVELIEEIHMQFRSEYFDVVFLLETIEHFLKDELTGMINEIQRILKPGGHIFITTPNEENLVAGNVLCPECGCVFHRGQHISTWSRDTLCAFMQQFPFETILCRAMNLRPESKLNFLRDIVSFLGKHKKVNLIYIGKKSE